MYAAVWKKRSVASSVLIATLKIKLFIDIYGFMKNLLWYLEKNFIWYFYMALIGTYCMHTLSTNTHP